jgi:hypothetical protein
VGIRIRPEELAAELRARIKGTPEVIAKSLHRAALHGQRILAVRTPRATGTTAARWRVQAGKRWANQYGVGVTLPEIYNPAPHIGVLELGARPHPVNAAGLAALTRWAVLVLGVSYEEAQQVANAIAWKLRHHGAKPTYFVRDSRGDLGHAVALELKRAFDAYARKKAGK